MMADGSGEERVKEAGTEERRKERAARRRSVSSAAKAARRGADGRNARPPAIGGGAADADWERGGGVEWGEARRGSELMARRKEADGPGDPVGPLSQWVSRCRCG